MGVGAGREDIVVLSCEQSLRCLELSRWRKQKPRAYTAARRVRSLGVGVFPGEYLANSSMVAGSLMSPRVVLYLLMMVLVMVIHAPLWAWDCSVMKEGSGLSKRGNLVWR